MGGGSGGWGEVLKRINREGMGTRRYDRFWPSARIYDGSNKKMKERVVGA